MELAFDTRELRRICEISSHADQLLGEQTASVLRRRLAELVAASSPTELWIGNPRIHPVHEEQMLIDLLDDVVLQMAANHPENPRGSDGKIAWAKVRRLKILGIGNSHD